MNPNNAKSFTVLDAVAEFFLRYVAIRYLPGRWFNAALPSRLTLHKAALPLKLEIVSHCWKYSEFLLYQLSSLVRFPPNQCLVTMTVLYSREDAETVRVLDFFEAQKIANVFWNFISLPKEQLFRRSIGRNIAAKSTKADWIWFTDCDVAFGQGALDGLASELVGSQEVLVYPRKLLVSGRLTSSNPLITKARETVAVFDLDSENFTEQVFTRAIGPIQVAHGDVARACGYCDSLAVYQKTSAYWRKAYEDRAFRWLLGSQGVGVDVPNVFLIRHAEKGRYQPNSVMSGLRKRIRDLKFLFLKK